MSRQLHIQPVPTRRRRRALRFAAAGAEGGLLAEARAAMLEELLGARDGEAVVWWGRRGRRCVAAAMVLQSAGRVGMLFFSPAEARGVEAEALPGVIAAASAAALDAGSALVQSLTLPEGAGETAALRRAGFERLAELLYLRRDLLAADIGPEPDGITWRPLEDAGEAAFGDVIARTYEGSLDCPRLSGLRTISDVIAGHKADGTFRPEGWWLAERDGEPAGCILVNDGRGGAEIAYLGVVPAHRGRGIGAAMVRHAARQARGRGRRGLTVAVDARNTFARSVYAREGFREVQRRLAWLLAPP